MAFSRSNKRTKAVQQEPSHAAANAVSNKAVELSDNRPTVQLEKKGFGSSAPRFQETFTTKTGLTGIKTGGAAPATAKAAVKSAPKKVDTRKREAELLAQARARLAAQHDSDNESEHEELTHQQKLNQAHASLGNELRDHVHVVGGSYAALSHGATRVPQDIDVMFHSQAAIEAAHAHLSRGESAFAPGPMGARSFKMEHAATGVKVEAGLIERHFQEDAAAAEQGTASHALVIAGCLTRWENAKEDQKQVREMIAHHQLVKASLAQILPNVKQESRAQATERWNSLF